MPSRGKLIAIEGIDGSGKGTQTRLLAAALAARGFRCVQFSFPRYDSWFGQLVRRFLNGEFGNLRAVDPHLSSLLYAGDRFEAKEELQAALATGSVVLADRYISSNVAHQSARVVPELRQVFLAWLCQLEYGIYGLPAEDLVVYLRLNVAEAYRLVGLKETRKYTALTRDLQEADLAHLEQAMRIYDSLAVAPSWAVVECTDPGTGRIKSRQAIHEAVLAAVESRVLSVSPL